MRRRTDGVSFASRIRRYLAAAVEGSVSGDLHPVAAGRLLLTAAGIVVMTSVPLLGPSRRGWTVLAIVGLIMLGVLAASMAIDWTALPRRAPLVFPGMVAAALVTISVWSPGLVAPMTGVLTFCFAYIGLTQPAGTSLLAAPVAGATLIIANGGWSRPVGVRLVIAISVWVMLAELLARLTRRQAELSTALRSAAHTDALTGVANRRGLELHITHAQTGDSMVICDLDHFKRLNDTYGHHVGDRVLTDFGAMLRLVIRERDYAARYGGEEFVLLLPATSPDQAGDLVRRMRETWSTLQPDVTFSAGIAACSAGRSHADTLSAADSALYAAKAAGRNTHRAEADRRPGPIPQSDQIDGRSPSDGSTPISIRVEA